MRVFPDLPDLTPEEAARCWLKPRQVLEVAALDDRDPALRKWFDNIVQRGEHLPWAPRTVGKITTRFFSLASAVVLRAMWEETQRQRTTRTAEAIARAVADLLPAALRFHTIHDFREAEAEGEPWRVLLVDIRPGDAPPIIHVTDAAGFTPAAIQARDWWCCSACFPHYALVNAVTTYAEIWGEQLDREAAKPRRKVSA